MRAGLTAVGITKADKAKLEKLLAEEILKANNGFSRLEGLTKELMKAKVVESADVPQDVITMNSKVLLKHLESGICACLFQACKRTK